MPTPKKFIQQAIEMETFFEDEEPTYDEFMRYPPFDSLMEDKFSLQNMINAYREGRIVFIVTETAVSDSKRQKQCNFITKEQPNTVFTIYNSSPMTYDEIDPTTLNEAFSSFIAKTLYARTEKVQGKDGKQILVVIWGTKKHLLLTTPYLKIYEPFNMNLPEFISKRLTELFERAKV